MNIGVLKMFNDFLNDIKEGLVARRGDEIKVVHIYEDDFQEFTEVEIIEENRRLS